MAECPFYAASEPCKTECADKCIVGLELPLEVAPAGPRYTTNGKEVLDRGQHFADATSPGGAELIASALNVQRP